MNKKWIVTIFFFILLIIDLLIPDPLPFLDEIVLLFATTVAGYFAIKKKQ